MGVPRSATIGEMRGHPRQPAARFLMRHFAGDWGVLDAEDKAANNAAIAHEGTEQAERVLSAYLLDDETKIWIITEWDRSATTILLPEEY